MIIVLIRTVILYILVIIAIRIMGKRQIGELQPSELVVTILVSNIATLPLEDLNIPLVMGVLPVLSLVCFEVIMSWLTLHSKKLRSIVSGTPKVIIKDGKLDQNMLKELRYSIDDLMTALRGNDIFDISEVQYAVVETNGSVSVYEKYPYRNTSNEDIGAEGENSDPPAVVISDGKISHQGLVQCGMDKDRINSIIKSFELETEDIFLMLSDKNGKTTIIRKEK